MKYIVTLPEDCDKRWLEKLIMSNLWKQMRDRATRQATKMLIEMHSDEFAQYQADVSNAISQPEVTIKPYDA